MDVSSLFPVYFIAIWFGTSFLTAKLGGWSELADKYRCNDPYDGPKQGWEWGRLNWTTYKACLWIAVTANGLYLETGPLFLFRAFHPPLCIPWTAISSVIECKYWWMPVIAIKFNDSNVNLMLKARFLSDLKPFLGEKIRNNQLIDD